MEAGVCQVSLSVVIVNFRTPKFVIECLETLLPELRDVDAKAVVVDNYSGDDSLTVIREWVSTHDALDKVITIQSDTNGGFASGNNIGIKALKADHYLLLNSDTLVRPGAIGELLSTAANNPQAGLFSPRLEWPDARGQESCFRFHSPVSEFLSSAQTGVFNTFLKQFVVPMPVQESVAAPDWTSFACVMIRSEVFERIGLLDEGYFMYFEDVEFCFRARKAGWTIVHNPNAHVVHLRGGSSSLKEDMRQKKRVPRYYYESRARYFYQSYGQIGLVASNLLWLQGRSISMARQLLGRQDKTTIERQWADIWVNCLSPLSPYIHPDPKQRSSS